MAEGGGDSSTGFGSELVFDFYCEFCNENGIHKEAAGHCTDCDEYLCGQCISHHNGNRYTRHHEVLGKENMPKDTPPASDRIRKDITTMCKQHKGRTVEYYCKSHGVLGCSSCIIAEHKTCMTIVNIPETTQSIFDDTEYKDFKQNLKSLENKVHRITTQSRDHVAKSKQCCSEAIEAVRQFRDDINAILDDMENKIKTQADTIKTKDITQMETLENECGAAKEALDKIVSEFKSLQSANRVCQAYITMKETVVDVEEIERQLIETEDKNKVNLYTFIPNTKLTEFLSKPDTFGLLSMEDNTEIKNTQYTNPVFKDVSSVSLVHDINVKSTSDENLCRISGSVVLSYSKLFVVDRYYKVKLVDTDSLKLISELRVAASPWDVTIIKEDQVAVTVPDQKTIIVLKVTDSITKEREMRVGGKCRGIYYSKNQLIVSYVDTAKIEIMDLQGNVCRTIDTDKDGHKLCMYPDNICVSTDGDTIYVSDYKSKVGKVISLSRNGTIKATYNDNNLEVPAKLCIDHRGNVFVCGYSSKNIHMITSDFIKIKEIVTQADGLTNAVYSVTHCRQTDRLYVGMCDYNNIKVYQLS